MSESQLSRAVATDLLHGTSGGHDVAISVGLVVAAALQAVEAKVSSTPGVPGLGFGSAATRAATDFDPMSPFVSLAGITARRPGLIPVPGFALAAPAAYVRYSATDSTQYSNNVGGGGGGVALAVGQRLVQVNDVISGNGRYAIASRLGNTAGGPTLVSLGGRRYWDFRGAETIHSQGTWSTFVECTLFALCRPRRHDFDGLFNFGGGAVVMRGGRLNCFNHSPDVPVLAGNPGTDVAVVVRITMAPSRRVEFFLDGVKVGDGTDAATSNPYPLNVGTIGDDGQFNLFDGLVAEWGVYDTALVDAHVAWLSQALRDRSSAPDGESTPTNVNLLVEGNSISDPLVGLNGGNQTGFGPPFPPTQQWPSQLAARHPSWTVTNLAVSSRMTAPVAGVADGGNVISPTFAAHLATYKGATKTNVVVIWELINHLLNLIQQSVPSPGQVAAQALLDLGTAAVTAGWKVVIGTGSNRDMADAGVNATYLSELNIANAYLRAHGQGTAWHALADLGGDARFQDFNNGLYILSTDHVHFTLTGQAVVQAEFFGPAIAAIA